MRGLLLLSIWFVLMNVCAMAQAGPGKDAPNEKYQVAYESLFGETGETAALRALPDDPAARAGILSALESLNALDAAEYSDASTLLALIHRFGLFGVAADNEKRLYFLRRAVQFAEAKPEQVQSRQIAAANLALALFEKDARSEEDWAEIETLARRADANPELHKISKKLIAFALLFARPETDRVRAAEPYLLAAEALEPDDAGVLWMLARGYDNAWFGEEDEIKACQYARKSAKHDLEEAYWTLGMCYLNGTGVESNEATAFEWVMKASQSGDPDGMISEAVMYALGQGTVVDKLKAAKAYRRAADAATGTTRAHALRGLGFMNLSGELDPDGDIDYGCALLEIAAEDGDDLASNALAHFGVCTPERRDAINAQKTVARKLWPIELDAQ